MICIIGGSIVRGCISNANKMPDCIIRPQIANVLSKQDII